MNTQHQHRRSRRSPRRPHLEVLEDRCLLSTYSLTDLGTFSGARDTHPTALNNRGQVVGYAIGFQIHRAFLWDSGTMTALDTLGGDQNEAYGINDVGQVTGWSGVTPGDRYTHHAFLWDSVNGMQDVWNNGVFFNDANALNNAGEVLGRIDPLHNGHAYLWNMTEGQVTDLCPRNRGCSAASINNVGQVAGSKVFDFDEHAALRNADGSWQDLGTLSGPGISYAYNLNDVGQVVGVDETINQAFLWQDGVMTDLDAKHHGSEAHAINNAGQIVGLQFNGHAVIWQDGVMTDLNTLVPEGSGLTLYNAKAINDAGQIVVEALDANRAYHAVLLTPDDGGAPRGSVDPSVFRLLVPNNETLTSSEFTKQLPASMLPEPAVAGTLTPLPVSAAVRQATDAVFARRHQPSTPAQQGAGEVKGLEAQLSLVDRP